MTLRLADVDPDRNVGAVPGQPDGQCGGAVIVEAHPVEQGPVGGQPEQARRRVARLRLRGDGADLGVAETQCAPGVQPGAVFVEAGGQTQRSGEVHPEYRAGQHRVDRRQSTAQLAPDRRDGCGTAQPGEHQRVDALGGHQEEQPAQRCVHRGTLVARPIPPSQVRLVRSGAVGAL